MATQNKKKIKNCRVASNNVKPPNRNNYCIQNSTMYALPNYTSVRMLDSASP